MSRLNPPPRLTFRARGVWAGNGNVFTGFVPAASKDAIKKISQKVKSWRLHTLAGPQWMRHPCGHPVIRGRMGSYGVFYKTDCLRSPRISAYLVRWTGSTGG